MRAISVRAFLGFIVLAVLSALAQAQTVCRERELQASLDFIEQYLEDQEKKPLRKGLEDYLAARRDAVARLLALLDDSSEGNELASEWTEIVDSVRGDAERTFKSALGTGGLSVPADAFVWTTTNDEDKYWKTVAQVNAAAVRDAMVKNRVMIAQMVGCLATKWQKMRDDDEYFDGMEASKTQEMRQMVADAVKEQVEGRKSFVEKLADLSVKAAEYRKQAQLALKFVQMIPDERVKYLAKLADLTLEVNAPLGKTLKVWQPFSGRFATRVSEFQSLVAREGAAFIVFQQTRESVREFLRDNDFDKVKERWKEVQRNFDAAASGLVTDGQKSDYYAFGREATQRLSRRLAECEEKYREFVSKNEGLFFGPTAPSVKEALVEKDLAEMEKRWWLDQDVDGRLRGWLDEKEVALTVDIEGWESQEERNAIRNVIRDNVKELVDAYEAALELLGDDQLQKLLDRTDLERKLE